MTFRATDAYTVEIDVGPPGSTGTITTPTGVVQALSEQVREEYDIDRDVGGKLYWRPDNHSPAAFLDQLRTNITQKIDAYYPPSVVGPGDSDEPLFTRYDLEDSGAMQKTVTTDTTGLLFYSKWMFEYEVRDSTHRTWLNALLACGLGAKNAYGLGYVHVTDQNCVPEPEEGPGPAVGDPDGGIENGVCPTCDRDGFKNAQGVRQHHARVHDERLLDERTCPNCRETFEVPLWKAKKFCGRGCSNEFRGKGKLETRSCDWCGLSLETWPSWDTEHHQECYYESRADGRDRPDTLDALARELYDDEERSIAEAWRLARGHGFDVTKDEFRDRLDEMGVLRQSLAYQLRATDSDEGRG
jgi:CRISPR-associated endoribonuclease Cas6